MARKTANLNVRLDPELKKEVQKILDALGLSPTEAVRAYFKQIQLRKGSETLSGALIVPGAEIHNGR